MRFWLDTEFYENGRTINLISIAVVAEDGREYYSEVERASELASATGWLAENVRPHLRGEERPRKQIAAELVEFMGHKPEIWGYYADYDWVAICQLHGRMIDLPDGWPMFCRDLRQLQESVGCQQLPKQQEGKHDALADARWTRDAWYFLTKARKAA